MATAHMREPSNPTTAFLDRSGNCFHQYKLIESKGVEEAGTTHIYLIHAVGYAHQLRQVVSRDKAQILFAEAVV